MTTVDLLIVNHNSQEMLQRLLESLGDIPDEMSIYICDSGSNDESPKWIRENEDTYGYSYVLLPNIGYAKSINLLASLSDGDVLVALNADVWMSSEGALAVAAGFADDIAVIGPKQRDESGRIVHAGIIGTNKQPRHRGWHEEDPEDELFLDQIDCVTVSGSAYFMRRDVWDELAACPLYLKALKQMEMDAGGAFLPTQHYYEETFYSYHARSHGYRVVYDGHVSVGHTWKGSSKDDRMLRKYFTDSRVQFRIACDNHGIERD